MDSRAIAHRLVDSCTRAQADAPVGQVKAHDAVVGLQKGGVHGEVGGAAGQGLHVHAPLLRVQAVGREGTGLHGNSDGNRPGGRYSALQTIASESLGSLQRETAKETEASCLPWSSKQANDSQ